MSTARAARVRALWALPITLLLLAIGWQALRLLRAADRAALNPEGALALDPRQGEAHYRHARAALQADPRQAEPVIRAALRAAPGDGRLHALLARTRDLSGAREQALASYDVALRAEPADYLGRVGRADLLLRLGRHDEAVRDLAVLLRTRSYRGPYQAGVHKALLSVAADPRGGAAVARWLAQADAVREAFVLAAFRQLRDPRLADAFYLAIERTRSGAEQRGYVDHLIRTGRWETAWLRWAESLDAAGRDVLGHVYDGGFELAAAGSGFEWRLEPAPGAEVRRVADPGAGGHVLEVGFYDQRVAFRHVAQPLLLAPGRYRLHGRVRLDELRGSRGLWWQLRCGQRSAPPFGATERFLGSSDWREFELEFDVPRENCTAQWLQLEVAARAPVEQDLGGRAWFDALAITRLPAPPPP